MDVTRVYAGQHFLHSFLEDRSLVGRTLAFGGSQDVLELEGIGLPVFTTDYVQNLEKPRQIIFSTMDGGRREIPLQRSRKVRLHDALIDTP